MSEKKYFIETNAADESKGLLFGLEGDNGMYLAGIVFVSVASTSILWSMEHFPIYGRIDTRRSPDDSRFLVCADAEEWQTPWATTPIGSSRKLNGSNGQYRSDFQPSRPKGLFGSIVGVLFGGANKETEN